MHFSFLPTFHHRIIASAGGRHPYAQCDQPIGDKFSLPSTGCLVALLSQILLYLKHVTAIYMKYLSQAALLETLKKFELVFIECPSLTCIQEGHQNTYFIHNDFHMQRHTILDHTRLLNAEKDRDTLSMWKEISLSSLHPSERVLPRYTKEWTTSNLLPSTNIIGSI